MAINPREPVTQYNDPNDVLSTIDNPGSSQMNTFFWQRKALIEAQKEMYFMPLADTISMPKHYGKEIKVYHYIPLLDDRNINDQGIDAAGVVIDVDDFELTFEQKAYRFANDDAAATEFEAAVNDIQGGAATKSGTGADIIVTMTDSTLTSLATLEQLNAVQVHLPYVKASGGSGNLYGSSKDIGTIVGKLPTLTEVGGRVNRVGFSRITRTGSLHKFGFFTEWTQESMDFDSDEELYSHMSRELVTGATQLTEAVLQKDLLAGAGTVVYTGEATWDGDITGDDQGDTVDISEVTYADFARLNRVLNDNHTPKQTKVIKGSRMIDTKTISGGRVIYIGSELENTVKGMLDQFDNPAFVPAHKYADAANIMNGEIGSVDSFRIVVVPEMLHWAGEGGDEGTNPGFMATNGKYNIYPMLVVGDKAFTTIGFQTDKSSKAMKFKITTKMPGREMASREDPYGEFGFSSIKWYYGMMILRPERIAVIKTVARV